MLPMLWGILGFIITIGILVTIHEWGHFWVARRFDVKSSASRSASANRSSPGAAKKTVRSIPLRPFHSAASCKC